MFIKTVYQTVTALLLSAMMALPQVTWAKASGDEGRADAKEGTPVILEPITTSDGRSGYIAMVPYGAEEETEVISALAKNHGKMILGVAGPDDPALQTALESGNPAWINSFIVADADQAKVVNDAPKSLRQKIKDKIKAVADLCKRERKGLITAMVVAGIMSGYVMVETSSVSAGMKALAGLFGWIGFQAMFSSKWEAYLDKGGELMTKLMTRALGRDVTPNEMQFSETAGKLHATWLANSGVVAYVFAMSGTSAGANVDGLLQAMWYGFLGSTDILDAAASRKVKQGKLPSDFFSKFVTMRIIGSACFEVAGYLHIPYVQLTLLSVTVATSLYLAFGSRVDPAVEARAQALKNRAIRARANARGAIFATRLQQAVPCEARLSKQRPPTTIVMQGDIAR